MSLQEFFSSWYAPNPYSGRPWYPFCFPPLAVFGPAVEQHREGIILDGGNGFYFLRDDEDDAISLFGDQQAGGIVLLQIFQNYFSGYTDDGNTEHLATKT